MHAVEATPPHLQSGWCSGKVHTGAAASAAGRPGVACAATAAATAAGFFGVPPAAAEIEPPAPAAAKAAERQAAREAKEASRGGDPRGRVFPSVSSSCQVISQRAHLQQVGRSAVSLSILQCPSSR